MPAAGIFAARAAQTRQTRNWPAKAIGPDPDAPGTGNGEQETRRNFTNSAMVIEMNENATPKDSKGLSVRWNT